MSSNKDLRTNIDLILNCVQELKVQRDELLMLIDKQLKEKARLEAEVERISYKLGVLSKNICQRVATKEEYDKTIKEAEDTYKRLTDTSCVLLQNVTKNSTQLQEAMDKKVGSDSIINVFENFEREHIPETNFSRVEYNQKASKLSNLQDSESLYVSTETNSLPKENYTEARNTVKSKETKSTDNYDFAISLREEANNEGNFKTTNDEQKNRSDGDKDVFSL